jgi:hypothetical protein
MEMNNEQHPDQVQQPEEIILCPLGNGHTCSTTCCFYDCETDQRPACIISKLREIDALNEKLDILFGILTDIQSNVSDIQSNVDEIKINI